MSMHSCNVKGWTSDPLRPGRRNSPRSTLVRLAQYAIGHYTDNYPRKAALIATPLTLSTPGEILAQIAAHIRALRLGANLTQAGLAKRAGVSYASLRAFERTGRISLLSFVKLCQILNKDGALLAALAPSSLAYTSIQDVVAATAKPTRKRGRLS